MDSVGSIPENIMKETVYGLSLSKIKHYELMDYQSRIDFSLFQNSKKGKNINKSIVTIFKLMIALLTELSITLLLCFSFSGCSSYFA